MNFFYNLGPGSDEFIFTCLYMGLVATKPVFGDLRTTKAQTDQRLCYSLYEKYHIST